jgi:predicted nucleotidyltransferase
MNSHSQLILRIVQTRFRRAGLDWAHLQESAREVVVFGSHAAGVNRKGSDMDVLVVEDAAQMKNARLEVRSRAQMKRGGLDLVRMSAAEIESAEWLGSELASHIAVYGLWLIGPDEWRDRVQISTNAGDKKERHLLSLARSVDAHWWRLHPCFHQKYRSTIRRELQRLLLLRNAIPIPPTRILDFNWYVDGSGVESLLSKAAGQAGLRGNLDHISRILSTCTKETKNKQAKASALQWCPPSTSLWLTRARELLRAQD